jgi:hypothetical protein
MYGFITNFQSYVFVEGMLTITTAFVGLSLLHCNPIKFYQTFSSELVVPRTIYSHISHDKLECNGTCRHFYVVELGSGVRSHILSMNENGSLGKVLNIELKENVKQGDRD